MMYSYAGIGSRQTSPLALSRATWLATQLAKMEYTLYSGGADGADKAFQSGAELVNGSMKIFLPWKGFNYSDSKYFDPPARAFEIADEIHPVFKTLSQGVQRLHARNVQQIMGLNLDAPVDFVICYRDLTVKHSGTDTAINLAKKFNIPVYSLYDLREWDIENHIELLDLIIGET